MNNNIQKRVQEHYDELIKRGYEVMFIGAYGSMNYGLFIDNEYYKSDVDTKAIVLPSFEDFVYGKKPISTTLEMDNGEHIDVKDIRSMFECFIKQNINFIEILFTDYYILNEAYRDFFSELLDNAEEIARLNINQALKAMAGMSMEKLKALQHPYPSIEDRIKKFGYDPKQAHHIVRINDFIKEYIKGKPYKECLVAKNKELLNDIKMGIFPVQDIYELCHEVDSHTSTLKKENMKENDEINHKALDILNKVKYNILKERFKSEIL